MSMSINFVKIKPKGINIEYHGSHTSGICTMMWYYFIYSFLIEYEYWLHPMTLTGQKPALKVAPLIGIVYWWPAPISVGGLLTVVYDKKVHRPGLELGLNQTVDVARYCENLIEV